MTPSERVILALDVAGEREALEWARRFKGRVGTYKVGLRLFTAAGPALVSRIANELGAVFLDLKLHDIPNTVAAAVRGVRELGVSMVTIHALGGTSMLRAASEAASDAASGARQGADPRLARIPAELSSAPLGPLGHPGPRLRILAVTVLTSLGEDDLARSGIARTVADEVVALAESAWVCGCDGVVASPHEVVRLRERLGPDALIVTPGIRNAGEPVDDQRRAATAREALDAGADHIVIGRPILEAPDPDAALDSILRSLE